MKNTKHSLIVLLLSTLIFSCSRETTTPNNINTAPNNGTFTYKVAGVAKLIDSASSTLYTSSLTGVRLLDVYAYKAGEMVLEMHFAPKTGSQIVGKDLNQAWLTVVTGINYPDDVYDCASGSFQLSVCDTVNNKLVGTFSFIGNNGKSNITVSDGVLSVNKMVKQ